MPGYYNNSVKRCTFTLNNYEEKDLETFLTQDLDYCIIGKEVSSTGTPHLQGYIEFTTAKRFSALKKICSRSHWEAAKGTRKQNIAYCSKEAALPVIVDNLPEDRFVMGRGAGRGQRVDLAAAFDRIRTHTTLSECINDPELCKYLFFFFFRNLIPYFFRCCLLFQNGLGQPSVGCSATTPNGVTANASVAKYSTSPTRRADEPPNFVHRWRRRWRR